MSRWLLFTAWALMGTLITSGTHYYIWARLVRDAQLPNPWHYAATAMVVALGISLPAAMLLSRLSQNGVAKPVLWTAFIWMGAMFMIVVLLGAGDFLRFVSNGISSLAWAGSEPEDPSKRLFIARLFGGAVALTTSLAGGVAVRSALAVPELRRVRIGLRRWPEALAGFSIVQISDLHVGPTIGTAEVESLVRRTNDLAPDLVVITGDLVDGSVADLAPIVAPLAQLRARHGVFFVTGNHEYYSGAPEWCAALTGMGIRVLRNERVTIGSGAAAFVLAGIDDASARGLAPGHGPDVAKALAGVEPEREIILLAHQPRSIADAAAHGVGLQLSGHTHGGQIFPFTYFVRLVTPYVAGLYRHNEHTQIYVSRGTGYWGPPMRLAAPSELTHLELHRAGEPVA